MKNTVLRLFNFCCQFVAKKLFNFRIFQSTLKITYIIQDKTTFDFDIMFTTFLTSIVFYSLHLFSLRNINVCIGEVTLCEADKILLSTSTR